MTTERRTKNRGRSNTDERGSSQERRVRKQWLLTKFGDGTEAPCWECGRLVRSHTMIVDRIIPGELGGRYARNNIRVHCTVCSGRQGQRRTTELRMRYIITYDAVKHPVSKRFTCMECGKRTIRSKTFRQTMSPFNRNANGDVKTFAEIRLELEAKAAQWHPIMHEKCEGNK